MTSQPLYNIPKGSILKLDGRELMVSVREESGYAVQCLDSGECFNLTAERVDDAIRARDCEVTAHTDASGRAFRQHPVRCSGYPVTARRRH